jgi:mannosyltransferase
VTSLVDEGVDDSVATAPPERARRLPGWLVPASVGAIVALGVVLRFVQRSPLWLDEALSVDIAKLPVPDLLDALRHDGHPPLYYLVLHYWMEVFGDGDVAVRALSGVLAVAALPLVWIAGKRLAGAAGGRWALVVVALSPYWIRYATETRMYALVMLLVLAGYLLVLDALDRPTIPRLVGIAVVSGLLLLSHYWAIYLVMAVGLVLALRWWRQPASRGTSARLLIAVAAGGLLFLPWLGGFLYQAAHTGTPWGQPFRPTAIVEVTLRDLGGGEITEAGLYGSVLLALALLALLAVRTRGDQITLDVRTAPAVRRELAVTGLVIAIGTAAGIATNATYQSRYAAVVVPLVLLAVAVGITRVPGPARLLVGVVYIGLALVGIVWVNYYQRTQSVPVGDAVAARVQPGDVVVYCPDQLGPAYSREMPAGVEGMSYPALTSPRLVDWVDYADRNAAADPDAVARAVRQRADGHAVFLVWMPDYRTLEGQCEQLSAALGVTETLVTQDNSRYFEPAYLQYAPPQPAATGGS